MGRLYQAACVKLLAWVSYRLHSDPNREAMVVLKSSSLGSKTGLSLVVELGIGEGLARTFTDPDFGQAAKKRDFRAAQG